MTDDPWGLAQGCGKMTRENSWLSRKYALFFFAFCTCYFHNVVEIVLAVLQKNGNIFWSGNGVRKMTLDKPLFYTFFVYQKPKEFHTSNSS